jgi:hypothetical protein
MSWIKLSFESHPHEEFSVDHNAHDLEDSIEKIKAMMKQQETRYTCCNYLNGNGNSIDEECRKRMVEWCYQTVEFFKLSRSSVHVAISCLDRFLSTNQGKPYLTDKSLYQLACITSLHVAIKVHEPVELGISMLVQLCRGVYTPQQIMDTERHILTALQWAVNPPSPKDFLRQFIAMLPRSVIFSTRQDLLDVASYQADMVLSEYSAAVLGSPSAIAVASLINAFSFCPETNAVACNMFFRSLGESTACFCDTEAVNQTKAIMLAQLAEASASLSPKTIPFNCHVQQRRSACANKATNTPVHAIGHHMSPIAIMDR